MLDQVHLDFVFFNIESRELSYKQNIVENGSRFDKLESKGPGSPINKTDKISCWAINWLTP